MAEDPRQEGDASGELEASDGLDAPGEASPLPLPPLIADVKALAFAEGHRRLEREGHAQIRDAHGCVFRFIDVPGSRLTTLAERSGFTKQAVGELVDDLERMGYVERVPDPSDGRAKIIRLTERGSDAYRTAQRVFDEIEREWAERLGADRVATLREVLEELVAEEAASPVAAGAASTT